MAKRYQNRKLEFDRMVYAYLVKRLREPINATDSYQVGAVDSFGAAKADNIKAFWAYTPLDRLIFNLRAVLGDQVKALPADFDDAETLMLMTSASDPSKIHSKYDGIVSIVEELTYLPPEQRWTGEPYLDKDSELTYPERVSRALTVATAMLYCMKTNGTPAAPIFGKIKDAVESTFSIRSIGSADEILGLMKSSGVADYRDLTNEGYLTLVRMAKWIVGHGLLAGDGTQDDLSGNWKQLSTVGNNGV